MPTLTPRIDAVDRPNIRSSEGSGTTTLSLADSLWQVFSLSSDHTVVLPSAGIVKGQRVRLENTSTRWLSVRAGATDMTSANGVDNGGPIMNGRMELISLVDTPTGVFDWRISQVSSAGWFPALFTASGGANTSIDISFQRVGRIVTLMIPSFSLTPTSGGTIPTAAGVIPPPLRPSSGEYITSIFVKDAGADQSTPGGFGINFDGQINLLKSRTSISFSNGAAAGPTGSRQSITYLLDM